MKEIHDEEEEETGRNRSNDESVYLDLSVAERKQIKPLMDKFLESLAT